MKLGEALAERARLQRQIGELRVRINANVTRQEDTEAVEDATALLNQITVTHNELAKLIARINLTNSHTEVEGVTLTGMLAQRDRLAGLVNTFTSAANAAQDGPENMRYMRSELKLDRTVNVPGLRARSDAWSADLRQLDTKIQEINWSTDLV